MFSFLLLLLPYFSFFFFNDTATTEIYTLSLHDALPICAERSHLVVGQGDRAASGFKFPLCHGPFPYRFVRLLRGGNPARSEEHTSELQSHLNLVCRLLLEKKKKINITQ